MKKNALIIIFILFCGLSFAQEVPVGKDQFYVLDNFSDMIKSHISPYILKDGSAVQALNVTLNIQFKHLLLTLIQSVSLVYARLFTIVVLTENVGHSSHIKTTLL